MASTRFDSLDLARLPARVRRTLAATAPPIVPKRHKHRAIPRTVDGVKFQSTKEANRWGELQQLQRAGLIEGLTRQVEFALAAYTPHGGVTVAKYVADFVYIERGAQVVEDVKALDRLTGKFRTTEAYRLKRAWVRAQYGITIRET